LVAFLLLFLTIALAIIVMPHYQPLVSERIQSEQKPRVLVVDDVPDNVQFLASRLRNKGFQVAAASNGIDALAAVAAVKPDLILLDVQMPEMDGFEVCQRLKANDETASIPVIFLTARTEIEDVLEGFNVGAVDYVGKPFQMAELLTRVRTHLELKYSQDLLRRTNVELAALNSKLIALNAEKNEFLSVAAHDLKNPLGSIRWLAELLRDGGQQSEVYTKSLLSEIIQTADRMVGIIKNLLDINAIEQGVVNNERSVVNLVIVAADIVANFTASARAKDIELILENTVPAASALVLCNADWLFQALENLVSNAIKYSPLGKRVRVRVHMDNGDSDGEPGIKELLAVSVEDEGPGIRSDERERLFTKFARLSAKPTANEHSTGLGLFIVKKLVESMDGSVRYAPNKPAGSCFTVVLPRALVTA
jgi:signal transduction histidine kinase